MKKYGNIDYEVTESHLDPMAVFANDLETKDEEINDLMERIVSTKKYKKRYNKLLNYWGIFFPETLRHYQLILKKPA